MKHIALWVIAIVLLPASMSSQCTSFLPVEKETKWEITSYNAKGKATGVTRYEMLDIRDDEGKLTFAVLVRFFDPRGDEIYSSTYDAWCQNNRFEVSMTSRIDGAALAS